MAINYPQEPEAVRAEAILGFQRIRKGRALAEPAAILILQTPHEVLTIDPNDVRQGFGLETAKSVGWRYLVGGSSGGAAGGTKTTQQSALEISSQNGSHQFSHLQEGWIGQQTAHAIETAEQMLQVVTGNYTLQLLRLPGIARTDALWLKDDVGMANLVIPIASASSMLIVGHAYSQSEFEQLIRAITAEPVFDNTPRS